MKLPGLVVEMFVGLVGRTKYSKFLAGFDTAQNSSKIIKRVSSNLCFQCLPATTPPPPPIFSKRTCMKNNRTKFVRKWPTTSMFTETEKNRTRYFFVFFHFYPKKKYLVLLYRIQKSAC